MPATGDDLGKRLRERDLSAAPAVLNLVESRAPGQRRDIEALLHGVSPAVLGGEAAAHVVGITGPPGAGKSTLLAELVRAWRARELSADRAAADAPREPDADEPREPDADDRPSPARAACSSISR